MPDSCRPVAEAFGRQGQSGQGQMVTEQTKSDGVGLAKGSKVGKYEIVERIGMGGQAIVYKAYDALLDRHVALKQISSHLAGDPKFMERFRKEAQILARLGNEQESIVTIHELIEDERGLFIVMEYLAGASLERILEDTKGPTETKATLQIIWRLAGALHAVHSAGVIHRDLKPSNIIIGDGLRPKITDFGVAAMSGDASMALGTTKYMAPELYGDLHKVDGRVDMYSLGFIAYEMLGGRPKFNEIFAEIIRDKHGEQLRWMKWHGNMSVAAPLLSEVNPSVPEPLSQIVAKMMAKNPDERFGSMEELGRTIKTEFSPRAKPASAKASARPTRRRQAAGAVQVRPRPVMTADDSGMGFVPPDAGDELVVSAEPQGAATALLPSRRLGRKVLLFFVLPVLLLGLIAGGGVLVYKAVVARDVARAEREVIRGKYSAGVAAMDAGIGTGASPFDGAKFASAVKDFQELTTKHPRSEEARKASVLMPLCEGYMAILAANWEVAVSKEDVAGQANKRLQTEGGIARDWTVNAANRVKNFHDERLATQSYRQAELSARARFDRRDYAGAKLAMHDELVGVALTPQLEAEKARFLQLINETEFRNQIQAQIQKAESLVQQVKFDEAEKCYEAARDMLTSEQASSLKSEEVKTYTRHISDAMAKITGNRTLNERLERVEKARASGDKLLLIVALIALDEIQPSQSHKDEIQTLRSEVALAKGRELKAIQKIEEARAEFNKSIQYKDNPEARAELTMLAQAKQRADIIAAGNKYFVDGKWAKALAEFEKAAQMGLDDTLKTQIAECKFQITLAEAHRLRMERRYAEALAEYEKAKAMKPSAAALINPYEELMAADQQYTKLMADGKEAMKKNQWAKARAFFEEAGKIRKTAEVDEAIADTRYGENFTRGVEAMEQKDYKGALGYFKLAQGFKNTPEVQEAIRKAEQADKAASPG
jgi:tRNA A-37 threonylcarbamoyl transferase component Bud32/tetratricopeptide (TPR) repeat protein